ncbi:MAG: hypothetical protein KJ607_13710, partial [Bacteroidetes bacterium]|nr:hypothetical protein [Bacteroidota bacterium]
MIYTVEDKQKSSSIVVIILLILAINHCNAQITISQRQPAGNDYNLNNLLDISVNNSTQMNTPVYLTASVINEENNEVLRCRKENIELLPGITLIDSKTLSNVKYRYSDNAFEAYTKENSSFPPGFYKVTVVAKSAVDDAELGQSVTEFTISRPAGALKAVQQYEKKVSPVKFSGFSEVFGDYSTCRGTNTEVPPAYAWLNINSDVSIYSIPVNISGLLSSAGNDGRQDVNTYSISFNSEKFNENLKNRASGIIREKTASVKEQDKVSRELNKLNRIFGNPQVQTELKQIKEIDSIEKQISTTNDTAELRILSEELSGYETLQKKREGYQRLIARKEKLDKLNSIYKETGDAAEYGKKIDYGVSMNVASFLSEEGAISGFEKAVSKVRNFHLGTCYPYYSPLTMAGMPVNGIYAETEIKNIYAVFSAGNLRRPAITNDMLHASYKRKLLSGGVGYGRKDGSHIHFHILDVCDDSSSVDIRNDIYGYHSTPKSNRVISTDIRYDLIKNILLIEAELAGSYHVNDMWLDAEPEITVDSSVYEFQNSNNVFGKIFTQKTDNFSSSVDYAYRINLQSFIPVTKTGLKVEAKRVGRDFISLGLPYLITDLMSYKLEMKQDFWKRRIAFSGFLKYNRDNLDGDNALTSRFLQPGGYV